MYRVWYSTESVAKYFIEKTILAQRACTTARLFESDANSPKMFHRLPDHIKQILYLDSPDIIVERDGEPIFSIELSTEAGTGHNVFQRFARLAASVENEVPAFYVYPEAKVISRDKGKPRWDVLNPLIFSALDAVMNVYGIPALFYAFPSHFRKDPLLKKSTSMAKQGLIYDEEVQFMSCPDSTDPEMIALFASIKEVVTRVESKGHFEGRRSLLSAKVIRDRRAWMSKEYSRLDNGEPQSPSTATISVPTSALLKHLRKYSGKSYVFGDLLTSRETSLLYSADAKFRGDPYPGCLAALDYMHCRDGKSFEERSQNLVMVWGKVSYDTEKDELSVEGDKTRTVQDFISAVRASESKNLLGSKNFKELRSDEIPRYYMQCRYGSTFSKVKHVRVYSYFADAILFRDGALWRDG